MTRTEFPRVLLSELVAFPSRSVPLADNQPAPGLPPAVFEPLQKALQKSYLELFETAAGLEFSPKQFEAVRKYLERSKDACVGRFRQRAEAHGRELQRIRTEIQAGMHTRRKWGDVKDIGFREVERAQERDVKVTLLNSKEINGSALPGGFLFLQRGLLHVSVH